jgi:uncharacterized protein (TIGR02246 family)
MKADSATEKEVTELMQRMADAYKNRDMEAIIGIFAADDDAVMYGTGADEKRVGPKQIRAQVERDWAQSDSTEMSFDWVSISAAGPVAWVASDVTINVSAGGEKFTVPARTTFVLEKRDGEWVIAQSHLSIPSGGQEEGESF